MLHNLSIGDLADRLANRQISSVELTRHFLARIERLNPSLNALITLTAEQALQAAQQNFNARQQEAATVLANLGGNADIDIEDHPSVQGAQATLDRAKLEILVEYLEGPFAKMNNRWNFQPASEAACEVEFFLIYEFRSRTLGVLMGSVFDAAFRRFAAAFERRADVVYG